VCQLREQLAASIETNANNVANYQLQVQELNDKLIEQSEIVQREWVSPYENHLLRNRIADLESERNDARAAARWLWNGDGTDADLERWPWLAEEDTP
jgi:hypothetical protein